MQLFQFNPLLNRLAPMLDGVIPSQGGVMPILSTLHIRIGILQMMIMRQRNQLQQMIGIQGVRCFIFCNNWKFNVTLAKVEFTHSPSRNTHLLPSIIHTPFYENISAWIYLKTLRFDDLKSDFSCPLMYWIFLQYYDH